MDLGDREVAVDRSKNESRMGPSGRRARSADSAYLLVGGSSDIYAVTVNFKSAQGHWCEKTTGERCHGNGNGKSRTYGMPSQRDKHDPRQWCKHVAAALADTEALAEAQEITARAFGKQIEAKIIVKPPVPAFDEPVTVSAADRLAILEEERDILREQIDAETFAECRAIVADALKRFGWEKLERAVKEVG